MSGMIKSAFARYVLSKQLSALALFNPSINGGNGTELVFNDGAFHSSTE
jgi:hypothetical protein